MEIVTKLSGPRRDLQAGSVTTAVQAFQQRIWITVNAIELPSWVRRAARSRQQSRSCGGWFQSRTL